MDYSFSREKKNNMIPHWSKVIAQMQKTRGGAIRGEYSEAEFRNFFTKAIADAEPLADQNEYVFWGFDAPNKMPSDARCDFFYRPTYIMVTTLIAGINRYPALLELPGAHETMRKSLTGCTGRNLEGHGYEAMDDLIENLKMFLEAGTLPFLEKYPAICPRFSGMLEGILKDIRQKYDHGECTFGWGKDYSREMAEVLNMANR